MSSVKGDNIFRETVKIEKEKWQNYLEKKVLNKDVSDDFSELIYQEDIKLLEELKKIDEGESREEKFYEIFHKNIEFGTGGLRGIVGAGSNRMNIYTVAKTTQGIAYYIRSGFAKDSPKGAFLIAQLRKKKYGILDKAVAISYDSRNESKLFATIVAQILSANGIDSYIYEEMEPTPTLSYTVRSKKCIMGIMITASHNPSNYNGYKVYDQTGAQLVLESAERLMDIINDLDVFKDIKWRKGLGKIEEIGQTEYTRYMRRVYKNRTLLDNKEILKELNVVYTPLNGAGNVPVQDMFKTMKIPYSLVEEQVEPDGNFPTCPYPNPEKDEALELGVKKLYELAEESLKSNDEKGIPDCLLATDPDSDRVAIITRKTHKYEKEKGVEYVRLSGNQVGLLLLEYLIEKKVKKRKMEKPFAITTFVSSKMFSEICHQNNIEPIITLTGFKFIAREIFKKELEGFELDFVMGFEESIGYLLDSNVRDKDAVSTSMIICEMMAQLKDQGKTLYDKMEDLYQKYGYIKDDIFDFVFEDMQGMEKMNNILQELSQLEGTIAEKKIVAIFDYELKDYIFKSGFKIDENDYRKALPKTKGIEIILEDGCGFSVRPSGTEPKIKFYLTGKGKTGQEADGIIANEKEFIEEIVKKITN